MGVRLIPQVDATATKTETKTVARGNKTKISDNDLPIPRNSVDEYNSLMKLWDVNFKDTMREWMGASGDPFGCNSSAGCDISIASAVTMTWDTIFPDLPPLTAENEIKIVIDRVSLDVF